MNRRQRAAQPEVQRRLEYWLSNQQGWMADIDHRGETQRNTAGYDKAETKVSELRRAA
jgi:hypothetical protein